MNDDDDEDGLGGPDVMSALMNLPKPKNDFEIVAPDQDQEDDVEDDNKNNNNNNNNNNSNNDNDVSMEDSTVSVVGFGKGGKERERERERTNHHHQQQNEDETMDEINETVTLYDADGVRKDASEIQEELERIAEAKRKRELKARSTTLQRNLPRPILVNQAVVKPSSNPSNSTSDDNNNINNSNNSNNSNNNEIDDMIKIEMIKMQLNDAYKYPHPDAKSKANKPVELDPTVIEDKYKQQAHNLLEKEMESIAHLMKHDDYLIG